MSSSSGLASSSGNLLKTKALGCKLGGLLGLTEASVASSSAVNPTPFVIPCGYGLVIFTALGTVVLTAWKAIKVGQARQEFKVPYPAMYSAENMAFNCIQRAHQNTLENYPHFLFLLLVGGLEMPYWSTVAGVIWIVGRINYARGYYTGDPRKRANGTWGIVGMTMLLLATLRFAIRRLW